MFNWSATIIRFAALALSAGTLVGCSTAMLTLRSNPPKAQIFAGPLGTPTRNLIGETPLTISASDLEAKVGKPGPVSFELKKEGFVPSRAVVTDLSSIDLALDLELVAENGLEDQEKLNAAINGLFECRRLTKVGKTAEALKLATELKKNYPQMAAAYEIEGGLYYLNKKYKEALDSYGMAAHLDPKNPAVARMHGRLETLLGIKRAPAAAAKAGK